MKKGILILFMAGLAAAGAFAVDFTLSGGGGALFSAGTKDAKLKPEYENYTPTLFAALGGYAPVAPGDASTFEAISKGYFDTKEQSFAGGIWAFFDATYAELDAALIWNSIYQTVFNGQIGGEDLEVDYQITQLNLSLFGKYPFEVGEKLILFPLVGIDVQIALADRNDAITEDIKSAPGNNNTAPTIGEFWNALWVKAGLGADYSLTKDLYLRGEVLYGVKFNSKYDTDQAKYWAESLRGVKNGPDIRLGLGYRFKSFGK